jgi:branched-chain amino acid transport system permease protein
MDILSALILQVLNGLVWGVCIALIAVGLSLVFGLTEVINFAHGEFFMAGAVVAYYILGGALGFVDGFWVALIFASIFCGVLGLILERLALRPLEGRVFASIIATFGLSLILQHTALLIFGPSPQRIKDPIDISLSLLGKGFPLYRIVAAAIGAALLAGLGLLIYKTKFGLWMRAVRYDREMAMALGIPVERVYSATFGLGAALAGASGVLVAPITAVEFRMGVDILPLAFMAVIVGGVSSLRGTVLAAILLGVTEGVMSVFTLPIVARVFTLVCASLTLLARPRGMLGRSE